MRIDMVLLRLHGAQTAEGCDDCEGDILERARAIGGADVPIGPGLDLHANVTAKMLANATVLMACKEFPHIDSPQRAAALCALVRRAPQGEITPATAEFDIPIRR